MKDVTFSGGMPRRNGVVRFVEKNKNTIIEVIAALFILLFAYTAYNKFLVLKDLRKVIKEYPLIGNFSELVAWGLPVTESIIVLLLFLPKTKRIGLICSLIMMSAFTLYLGYMLIFTPKLPCTCGGMLQQLSWPQHLMFNLVFILLAIWGLQLYKRKISQ
jgi:putative oxidoreductase